MENDDSNTGRFNCVIYKETIVITVFLQKYYTNIKKIFFSTKGLTNKPFFDTIILCINVCKGEKNGYILYSKKCKRRR